MWFHFDSLQEIQPWAQVGQEAVPSLLGWRGGKTPIPCAPLVDETPNPIVETLSMPQNSDLCLLAFGTLGA